MPVTDCAVSHLAVSAVPVVSPLGLTITVLVRYDRIADSVIFFVVPDGAIVVSLMSTAARTSLSTGAVSDPYAVILLKPRSFQ